MGMVLLVSRRKFNWKILLAMGRDRWGLGRIVISKIFRVFLMVIGIFEVL